MNIPSRRTALVLGANGRLGASVATAFAAAGWRVIAQVRRPASAPLPSSVVPLRVALDDTDALAAAGGASKIDVVVHAINPIYTRWDAEALPALDAGLAVAARTGALFMLPGNVYNFGDGMPALIDERTPFRPTTRKGEIRVRMEARIAERAAADGFPGCVVRAGDFFGAGTGNWFDQAIVKSLAARKLVYPGPLDVPHAWAYLPDLGRAFVRVAEQVAHPSFATWHFEGHTLTGRELLDAIESVVAELHGPSGRAWRRGGLPWSLIRAIGIVRPMWRELARMSYMWRVPHVLDGRALAALPGPSSPSTPLAAALRASLRALGHGPAPHAAAGAPSTTSTFARDPR